MSVFFSLINLNVYAVPVVDGAKNTNNQIISLKNILDFKIMDAIFQNNTEAVKQSSGMMVDALNNGFANQVARDNQLRVDLSNQQLRQASEPVDMCHSYSVSEALNDLSCQALSQLSDHTQSYIEKLTEPYQVAHDVEDYQVLDANTVAISTAPKTYVHQEGLEKIDTLKEQAFKVSVFATLESIKQDQENIVNPLSNSMMDDFNDDSVQHIQEKYNHSQLYRTMLVMRAKRLSASMNDYKHQLQKEMLLALKLLSLNKQIEEGVSR